MNDWDENLTDDIDQPKGEMTRGRGNKPMLNFNMRPTLLQREGEEHEESKTDDIEASDFDRTDFSPENQENTISVLSKHWKASEEEAASRCEELNGFLHQYAHPDALRVLEKTGIGNSPFVIDYLYRELRDLREEQKRANEPNNMREAIQNAYYRKAKDMVNQEIHRAQMEYISRYGAISMP